jgi:glycosyltransferase involved in cell wall biosynthesis
MPAADASGPVAGPASAPATLLMVGRLDRTKDHRTLLGAVALLRWRWPVRLVIAGDGPLRAELEAEAHWLAIAADVDFLGARADIAALLAAADVFVFAAKPEEGLGIALLEAMAAGVPAVASDVGGCREVLAGGTCGLLTPPGDAPAMADAVAGLLADPALAADLAGRARARAVAVYGRHEMARRYAALLTPR